MKLTKGRIHKIMKSHRQTAKAIVVCSRKRSNHDFTRRVRKRANLLNKTMYNVTRDASVTRDPSPNGAVVK